MWFKDHLGIYVNSDHFIKLTTRDYSDNRKCPYIIEIQRADDLNWWDIFYFEKQEERDDRFEELVKELNGER